jgi:magnesium-transporting ATPase (P-type)
MEGEALKKDKKKIKRREPTEKELAISKCLSRKNICFMGTTIASGSGFAVIVYTGKDTYMASNAELLMMERPPTAFDKGVKRVAFLLMLFMLVMVPLVIVINGLTTKVISKSKSTSLS